MELTDELKVLVEAEVGKALQEFDRLNKKVDSRRLTALLIRMERMYCMGDLVVTSLNFFRK